MFDPNDEFELIVLTNIGPEKRSAVVIDNFYKNPDQIRQLALTHPQITAEEDPELIGGLPGNRIYISTDEVTKKLKSIFLQLCSELPVWKHKFDKTVFDYVWKIKNSGFTCNVVSDRTLLQHPRGIIPHQDYYRQQNSIDEKVQFGCVIYLNTPEECKGGTSLYSYQGQMSIPVSNTYELYRTDNEDELPKSLLFEKIYNNLTQSSDWKIEKHFPMRYNRCVLYEADVLHSAVFDLGMYKDYSRINQVLFM